MSKNQNTAPGAGRTILLVEDDPTIAGNQARLLEKAGYRVVTAGDCASALASFRADAEAIDLVLMDIDLGQGADGPQTARDILAVRHLPVVFLSAHAEKTYVERTGDLESYGYVVKNAGASVLLASVSMAFRLWDSRQRQQAEERQYRVLVESSPDVIMRFDREFTHLYVSPSATLLGDRPPEGYLGRRVGELGYGEDLRERWENSIGNVFATAESVEQEIRLQRGGQSLDLNWRLIPEKDEYGRVSTVLSIIRDISPQKRAEAYRLQNELRMAFLLDLYSHAGQLTEQEIGERAVRMARELSGSHHGFLYRIDRDPPPSPEPPGLAACLERREQLTLEGDSPRQRAILVPVLDRGAAAMVLGVSGKRIPYDDNDRAQLQLAANEIWRMLNRRQADEALQESHRQYQSILNTASDGFYMTDEAGQLIDANEVYVAMSGYRRNELLKMNIANLEPAGSAADHDALRRRVIAMGKWRHEGQQRRKNGQLVDLEVSTTYIASSHRFVSFVRDISDRKRSDLNLQRMQHLLAETGRIARIGGWEYLIESKRMTWTEEVFRIHDLSMEFEPTLDRAMAFLDGESLPRFSEAFRRAVEAREPFDLELSLRSATGRSKCVRVIGRPITRLDRLVTVSGTIQDLTDQRHAASAAREKGQTLDRFFNLAHDLLGVLDAEGRYQSLNEAWAAVTGYPPEHLIGQRFVDFLHPEETEAAMEAWQAARSAPAEKIVNRLRAADGTFRWIEWRCVPAEGGVYIAGLDRTELREAKNAFRLHAKSSQCLRALLAADFAEPGALLEQAVARAVELSDSALGYIHLIDSAGGMAESCTWSAAVGRGCALPASAGHRLEKAGIWADSLRVRRPVIHNDFQRLPDRHAFPEGHNEIRRHLSVPALADGAVRLIVGVANKADPYDDDDSRELQRFAEELWEILAQRFPSAASGGGSSAGGASGGALADGPATGGAPAD